jgi:hypothetical protein
MNYLTERTVEKLLRGGRGLRSTGGLFARALFTLIIAGSCALAQMTPSDDSYTLTNQPTTNFGAKNTMLVESSGATSFVRFDLSAIPSSVTGSMVARGTLKIFVATVPTAGSFNVDLVTSSWKESTITANNSPTLGSAIASAITVAAADKDQYILIDVTTAVVDWLNGTPNDGLALVPDGAVSFTLNSKETTTTSHPAELDIVLTGPAGPPGPISGVTAGPGLTGGGTKGNVTISLLTSCSKSQILQWNGSTWACSNAGTGTVTGVTAGTDLTGGGSSGSVTLNLDTTKVPQLAASNTFTGNQTLDANGGTVLNVTQTASSGTSYGINATTRANTNGNAAILGSALASAAVYGVQGYISSNSEVGAGVFGSNAGPGALGSSVKGGGAGVWGDAGTFGSTGVLATADATTALAAINNNPLIPALESTNDSTSGTAPGISGNSNSSVGIGVLGNVGQESETWGENSGFAPTGVSGDSGNLGGIGVWGTADSGYAIFGENNGPYVTGLFLNSSNSASYALEAGTLTRNCLVDTGGDLTCTGNVSGAVQGQGGRVVRLYAVQSPDNWFEDFGSATLKNGSATIPLDPNFAATVNTSVEYHVFITPKGDSEALYIANETASGFEVHEHGGGRSNISFDYRIVGRRKGYENVRLEDVTEKRDALAALNQQLARKNDPATRKQREEMMRPQFHAVSRAGAMQKGVTQKGAMQKGLAVRPAGHHVVAATKH